LDPEVERDPVPGESIHIDLCSIAMSRLQSGHHNGGIVDGVIPIKYRRVPCPVTGNIHVWLLTGASNYYFALTVVNVAGLGAATIVEAQMGSGEWATLERDPNYNSHRPQERFGTWVTPAGSGPFDLPISLRFTNAEGTVLEAPEAIQAFDPADASMEAIYFIDTGVQF
jgi:expansin (peptidoglycan-binding protein)